MEISERAKLMIEAYGEAVTFAKAGRIVHRHPATIKNMIKDGRLKGACDDERVDVYSLAEYVTSPKEIDSETRMQKKYPNCAFRV